MVCSMAHPACLLVDIVYVNETGVCAMRACAAMALLALHVGTVTASEPVVVRMTGEFD
jgi:hypothetical protein